MQICQFFHPNRWCIYIFFSNFRCNFCILTYFFILFAFLLQFLASICSYWQIIMFWLIYLKFLFKISQRLFARRTCALSFGHFWLIELRVLIFCELSRPIMKAACLYWYFKAAIEEVGAPISSLISLPVQSWGASDLVRPANFGRIASRRPSWHIELIRLDSTFWHISKFEMC